MAAVISQARYDGCEACETSPGWKVLQQGDGIRLTRCACWKAYQAKLVMAGVSTAQAVKQEGA